MIMIQKVIGGYRVQATPPHVHSAWQTEHPQTVDEIIKQLFALGAHQTDIGDAFYAADPDWLSS
jgi:hypothetical protein